MLNEIAKKQKIKAITYDKKETKGELAPKNKGYAIKVKSCIITSNALIL